MESGTGHIHTVATATGTGTDVLFWRRAARRVVTPQYNVAQNVDLLVGVVPIVNLEWIQKLIRDTSEI